MGIIETLTLIVVEMLQTTILIAHMCMQNGTFNRKLTSQNKVAMSTQFVVDMDLISPLSFEQNNLDPFSLFIITSACVYRDSKHVVQEEHVQYLWRSSNKNPVTPDGYCRYNIFPTTILVYSLLSTIT